MKQIELVNTLPRVFAPRESDAGDIWLKHVTLERGKNYLVVAESGTGKSSMCSFIYGYRVDYLGDIIFDSVNVRELTVDQWCEIRLRHIAYLPQEMRLFPELTVLENINLKNRLTCHKSAKQVMQMLERLGVADKADEVVSRLSIGQQQRVAIVRTLCQPADFILLDEPVSHLDDANNAEVARLIAEEAQAQGASVIATSVGNNIKINFDKELRL